jgi:Fe2+ or Zn2+ uptake regulation protein
VLSITVPLVQDPAELTTLFRAHGLRVTPQRQCIFRVLAGNDRHPTMDAIFEAARTEMPTISLKTVYQTVHDLAALGEVAVLDLGTGSVRVDPNVEGSHHHLVCTSCGMVRDLPVEYPNLNVPARQRHGFVVDSADVIFRGLCAPCRARSKPT